jgi:hypothetical protein
LFQYFSKTNNSEIKLTPLDTHKWAGWFDLYSKNTWENFYSVDNWNGYGANDLYSMMLSQYAKNNGLDFQQYVLNNTLVCEYEIGPLKEGNLSKHYKDMIVLNDIPNQREQFESKINEYLQKGIQQLKDKNII